MAATNQVSSAAKAPRHGPRASIGLLVVFALGVCVWGLCWPMLGGHLPLHPYDGRMVHTLSWAEGKFYLAALALEALTLLSCVSFLARRWPARVDTALERMLRHPGRTYAAIAFAAASLALLIGIVLVRQRPLTEDEGTYLFQARLLLSGHLSVQVPPQAYAFHQPFFYVLSFDRWTGYYQWAQPALLALGLSIHALWLVPALELSVTVFFSGKLAEEFSGDPRAGIAAALLVALSPLALLTAGTLHNSNLSAACAAITLWAFVRLDKRLDWRAVLALGLAAAIGMHCRPLDQFALTVGTSAIFLLRHRREIPQALRRLIPAGAVAGAGLVVHVLVSSALREQWRHTSVSQSLGAFGFGKAIVGVVHTPMNAASLLLTDLVHVSFYLTGAPLVLALLVFPGLRITASAKYIAPVALAFVYSLGYFLFGGWSVLHTGPVYYYALLPLLSASLATAAVDVHERMRDWPRARRVVPAFLVAQALASVLFFWPTQALELSRASTAANRCQELVDRHRSGRALAFVVDGTDSPDSWVQQPPIPSPAFDDPVLFARFPGYIGKDDQKLFRFARWVAATYGRERETYIAKCIRTSKPSIGRFDVANGKVEPLRSPPEMRVEQLHGWLERNVPLAPWSTLPPEIPERVLAEIR